MQEFVEVMLKHLPPSASELRLLDIGGMVGDKLAAVRNDLVVTVASLYIPHWTFPDDSVDAVVAYDVLLSDSLLAAVLKVMRPGGRLIVVHPANAVDPAYVQTLENAGYVRILVEPALYPPSGVLIRGEKVHTTADTLERVEQVAARDSDTLDLEDYRGRYVHLLVQQTPNKPVWKLTPDEVITWHATTVERENQAYLLAFSSLPKAVSFMQAAVMGDFIRDVNKVAKFSKETAHTWTTPLLLNPTLESVQSNTVNHIAIDPQTAETPDE
jgi:SAM-dependent methyltransferase